MESKTTRTKQSVKNAGFTIGAQLIQQILRIIVRIIFIRVIGQEYLGLNSVFTEIITALQLVELGIGPAMAYSLYKPLAENNNEKVKSLMALFKKAYRIIGIVILIGGIAFTPFYGFFINEMPDIPYINLIYLMFVFDTAISYFYSYYRILLVSDQKKYIDTLVQTGVILAVSALQIILMITTHDYKLYILGQIINTILLNFIASRIAIKQYPYLKEKDVQKLDDGTYKEIKKNVFAMVFHKFGSIVRDATDNLFISKYIGLAISGAYSNYSMITRALTTVITQVFGSVLSSVGNLNVTANDKAKKEVFYNINFINFWIAAFCACCFGVLIDPFVLLIADESYVLDKIIAVLITFRFYLDIMRKTPWMFCEAAGIYWNGRTKPLWEALVNLIVSLLLVKTIGMPGIFIGTIVTILAVDLTIEPYLAFKYVLNGGLLKYYIRYGIYLLTFIVMLFGTYIVISFIPGTGISVFVLKTITAIVVTNVIFVLLTFKTKEFNYAFGLLKKCGSKFLKRKEN